MWRQNFLFLFTQQIDDNGRKAGLTNKGFALLKDRIVSLAIKVDALPRNIRQLFKSSIKGVRVNHGSRAASQLTHRFERRSHAGSRQKVDSNRSILSFKAFTLLNQKNVIISARRDNTAETLKARPTLYTSKATQTRNKISKRD